MTYVWPEQVEKITIFRDNPMGVVAVKFIEGGAVSAQAICRGS